MVSAPARRHYRLLHRIATGGMAEVFLSSLQGPAGFERKVVIKRILPRWAHNEDVLSLFRDEARLGSILDHPNIVQVLDYGRHGDGTFLVLEYVEGRNLAELISVAAEEGRYLPSTLVAYVASEMCAALENIHDCVDQGGVHLHVIHRDVNPANVLISHSGEVKLTDFGVAAGHHRELQTQHGILRGTFPYMSPEQTRSAPLQGRSDLFSLGICIYEALTAQHPFADDEDYLTIKRIQDETPPAPNELRVDVDPALANIVMRCLEKDPEDRFPDAKTLRGELLTWLRANRATHGAGRLSRLMAHHFPSRRPPGEAVDSVEISLGPTTPGQAKPILDISSLDRRGSVRRVGGAITPRDDAIPAAAMETNPDLRSPVRLDFAENGVFASMGVQRASVGRPAPIPAVGGPFGGNRAVPLGNRPPSASGRGGETEVALGGPGPTGARRVRGVAGTPLWTEEDRQRTGAERDAQESQARRRRNNPPSLTLDGIRGAPPKRSGETSDWLGWLILLAGVTALLGVYVVRVF